MLNRVRFFTTGAMFCALISGCGSEGASGGNGGAVPKTPVEVAPKDSTDGASTAKKKNEQSVLAYLKLSNNKMGTKEDFQAMSKFEQELSALVKTAQTGKHDGNEIGEGVYEIFFYGPDADKLNATIEAPLKASPLSKGARVVKRYGNSSDEKVKETTIEIDAAK